jgi:hypothetical protein
MRIRGHALKMLEPNRGGKVKTWGKSGAQAHAVQTLSRGRMGFEFCASVWPLWRFSGF